MFEAHKAGRIVVLGSVAGDRGRLSNYVYGSAKAGLHAYLQGLRARLWRSGVTVTTVKPGPVDTAMTYGLDKLPLLVQPEAVAAACLKAAQQGAEQVYVPVPWRLIMAVIRAIPERIFKRLSI
jgi:short-subunit dehydrogenase